MEGILLAVAAQSQNSLFKIFLFSGLQCLAYSLDVAVSLLKKCAPFVFCRFTEKG